jgi:hypothetical protein
MNDLPTDLLNLILDFRETNREKLRRCYDETLQDAVNFASIDGNSGIYNDVFFIGKWLCNFEAEYKNGTLLYLEIHIECVDMLVNYRSFCWFDPDDLDFRCDIELYFQRNFLGFDDLAEL